MADHPEHQQISDAAMQIYLAFIISESQTLANPPTSSSSESSDNLLGNRSSSSESASDDDLPTASDCVLRILGLLYSCRYLVDHEPINKGGENLRLLLTDWKHTRPDIFRAHVHMTPECFNVLLAAIQTDPVFHSQSNRPQMPIDMQLAIALYCFGHYGNAISTTMVSLWAGIGYGTVCLVINCIMTAVCQEQFRRAALYWPTGEEKEEAKQWMVLLYSRPGFFGNSWYDRKFNYSLNVQVVLTPDLRIMDYSVGLPGSQHDSTAFMETCIYKEHQVLLEDGEWMIADTAYPLHDWCQAPYKKSEKDTVENTTYNYYISKICIHSEHAMGYLKGTWQSL
ncbi:hypothetical protein BDN67DRAFT_992516 [Paxillus ammoniavirescens]|nr:hypothetical protein BDN67DRAFT_992516 [Paxillus ammoniavirescens]